MGYSGPNLSNLSNLVQHTFIMYKTGSTYYAFETSSGTVKYSGANFVTVITSVIGAMTRGSIFIKNAGTITIGSTITITDKPIHIYGDNTILDISGYDGIAFRFVDSSGHAVLDCGMHDFELIGNYLHTSEIFAKFEEVKATIENCFTTSTNKVYNLVYLYGNCSQSRIYNCSGAPRYFVVALNNGAQQSDYVNVTDNNMDLLYDGAGNYTYFVNVTYGNYWRIANNCIRNGVYNIDSTYMKYATVSGNNMTGGVTTLKFGASCDFCTIQGNVIINGYANLCGIYVDSSYGTTITGNIIYSNTNTGFHGIELNSVRRVTITGNEIYIAGSSANCYGIYDAGTSQEVLIMNNLITSETSYSYTGIYIATSLTDGLIAFNEIRNCTGTPISVGAKSNGYVFRNVGYVTHAEGATSVADGGTISHGLVGTPTGVICTPITSGEMVSVTAKGATTFTVAIKTHAGAAGTTQVVHWYAYIN
jgi:parallel beta-helix repeat protein